MGCLNYKHFADGVFLAMIENWQHKQLNFFIVILFAINYSCSIYQCYLLSVCHSGRFQGPGERHDGFGYCPDEEEWDGLMDLYCHQTHNHQPLSIPSLSIWNNTMLFVLYKAKDVFWVILLFVFVPISNSP